MDQGILWQEMTSRTSLLLGEDGIERLKHSNILLVGLGGVGGAVAYTLVRAGISQLTLVDGDVVSQSNLNRQMIAYVDTIGKKKTEALATELKRINPYLDLSLHSEYLTEEEMESLVKAKNYDYVIDAIDTLAPKTALLESCWRHKIPVISAMGAGAKLNPFALKIDDISNTHTCALAKAVRKSLRAKGIAKGVEVLFSSEKASPHAIQSFTQERGKRSTVGTVSYLPNLFGVIIASHVIRKLVGDIS